MNSTEFPRVAVLLATHNDGALLNEAVESICSGTYPADIFIIDDCSKEPVLREQFRCANKVTVLRLSTNLGLTKALNFGLQHILHLEYELIARMDADDYAHPFRIERQVRFLQENPTISLIGCWANYVDASRNSCYFKYKPPSSHRAIQAHLPINSCIAHPTWLVRSETFRENGIYDESYTVAQDYEFLLRLSSRGIHLGNVPEVLFDYRVAPTSISHKKRRRQLISRLRAQLSYFRLSNSYCWQGIIRTLILLSIPIGVLRKAKSFFFREAAN